MKKLISFYNRNKIEILFITNIVFIGLAIAVIILHLISLDNVRIDRWLAYTIPLVSPVVLLLAFRESVKANRIQTSAHFYEDEARKLPLLKINSEINATRKFGGIDSVLRLSKLHPRNIDLINTPTYLYEISKALEKYKDDIGQYYLFINNHFHEVKRIDEFLAFYDGTYLPAIAEVLKKKGEINRLYEQKFLIPQHKNILFSTLYSQVEGFLVFSKSLQGNKPIHNPTVYVRRGKGRKKRDFFDVTRVKILSDGLSEIVPPVYKLINP